MHKDKQREDILYGLGVLRNLPPPALNRFAGSLSYQQIQWINSAFKRLNMAVGEAVGGNR